jgi:hypothetical protein
MERSSLLPSTVVEEDKAELFEKFVLWILDNDHSRID